jgi:uncharacterized protein with HEPN domain
MSRNPRLYLEDIQKSCVKVLRFSFRLNLEQFKHDELIYDAVLRNLEIIGEAAKNVPDDIRQQFPLVEWRKISGFRDIVVHQYFSISDSILWDIIQNKIPELNEQIEHILREIPA